MEAAGRYGQVDSDFPDGLTTVDLPPSPDTTTLTDDGAAYGESFTALDGSYQWLEIGVKVANTQGSRREMGLVTLVIDLEA